ncbi:MAG: hypothetical protein KF716_08815 [Anaerolineae bacterium]|nr:hypothetical protein [Anaerolineae bacterium]
MPALSASKQRKWRIHPHQIDLFLVLLKPVIVFRALVNMASVTYPTASITFDNVTVGAYTDIQPGMTIRIGSDTKKSDYGTTYVRAAATSSTIPIGWSSRGRNRPGEVDLQDNAVIEVLAMREIWMETPRITDDGTIYKKYDIAFDADSPPVANIGPDYAEFVSSGTINVLFNDTPGQSAPDDFASFATAPGASISSRAWDFADGTPSSASTTNPGSVSFPAGHRYASLTVTDSNGKTHTAYALIVACETSGANAPITNFQLTSPIRHTVEGKTIQFKVNDELDSADYPPGTRVLIFAHERCGQFSRRAGTKNGTSTITGIDTTGLYEEMPVSGNGVPFGALIASIDSNTQLTLTQAVNGTGSTTFTFRTKKGGLTGPTGRSQMIFSGWLTDEDNELSWSERGIQKGLTFTAVDAAGRLAQLPGFPQEMRRKSTPTKWTEAVGANIPRYIYYLLYWHSNVFSLCDFKWTGEDYNFSWLGSDGATLYEQANQRAEAMAARLGCDFFGRMMISYDPMLQNADDRTSVEAVDILDSDWRSLKWKFTQPPRVHWLRGGAILTSTADSDLDNPYAVFARAPGFAPGQGGGSADQNYQLVRTTDEEWDREGHRYAARLNAKKGMWGISLVHGAYCGIDPIRFEWIRLRVSDANKSLRGDSFPDGRRFLPAEVSYTYDQQNGAVYQEISAEEEVIGTQAVDDPQPAADPNPYGNGGPPVWDELNPIPLPPPVDIGDLIFDPALPMPLNPLPGSPQERGILYGATVEGRVFKVSWPGGTLTFADRSPAATLRNSIGTIIGLRRDARNYKKYWLYGAKGILATNDITVSVPAWKVARALTTGVADTDNGDGTHTATLDFSAGTGGMSKSYTLFRYGNGIYIPETPVNSLNYADGGWTTIESQHKTAINAGYSSQELNIGRSIDVASTLREIKLWWTPNGPNHQTTMTIKVLINNAQVGGYGGAPNIVGGSPVTFSLNIPVQKGDIVGWSVFYSADLPPVDSVTFTKVELKYDFTNTEGFPVDVDETYIADFQGCINKKDVYYWLSVKPYNSVDYVYFNATFDNFATRPASTRVAKYVANMSYGITVSSFNYRKVWVAAGDPGDTDAALYASIDGGTIFLKTSAALNQYGGAPWLNYSKGDKSKNTTDSDIMRIKGRDGSNNFQFVKGISGTPVTVVASATKQLITPLAFGVIARDLDYVRIAFNDGDFYVSSNAGTSWAASATAIPAGGDVYGWSQFPSDPAFALAYGDQTLAYTTDTGATWEDLWSDYDTWRSGEYGTEGEIVVSCLPDLSIKYPVPIGG